MVRSPDSNSKYPGPKAHEPLCLWVSSPDPFLIDASTHTMSVQAQTVAKVHWLFLHFTLSTALLSPKSVAKSCYHIILMVFDSSKIPVEERPH